MERECGVVHVGVCCLRFEMGSPPRGLGLLGVVVAFLLAAGGCSGSSSSHSLRYFYTGVSEPGQGLPWFSIVGYVDEQPFVKYDSHIRRTVPHIPWMEEFGKDDPQYWEGQSQMAQGTESTFRVDLGMLRERFNQQNSTGLHTLQWMVGCEVGPDGQPRGGHFQHAYDGEDFLAFDKGTISWIAAVPQAMISKQKLDRQLDVSYHCKDYLEKICVEWLWRYLDYGSETLQRTEAPTARVSRKKSDDGRETLFCHLYGFYPKEIEVTWMKDGEDRMTETWTGGVVPNSDGTYNTWVSIEVDPKERNGYRCRVGHDSLLEFLELAWEEPASASNLGLILGIVGLVLLAALLLVAAVVGVAFYMHKQRQEKDYKAGSGFNSWEREAICVNSVKLPLEVGVEPWPVKRPLQNGHKPILRSSSQRTDSSSSGGSSQSTDSSGDHGDLGFESSTALV